MKALSNTSVLSAAALIGAISFSSSAGAGAAPDTTSPGAGVSIQTVTIPYSVAEVATETGRAELHGKIRRAAREVCGPAGLRDTGSLAVSARNRKCYQEAVDAAMSQVGYSQLASAGG